MTWIGLAVGASVTGELSDYIAGVSCRTCRVLTILLISQVFGLVLVLPVVATLSHGPPRGDFIVWACLAGVAEAIAFAAFYRAMTTGAISIVAPVTATAAVAPLGVGLASGERLGAVATAGIALALVGVAAVAYEAERAPPRAATRGSRRGSGWRSWRPSASGCSSCRSTGRAPRTSGGRSSSTGRPRWP